jgi:hypothetical protein
MGCGCEATISEDDPRAEIWLYIFGKKSFPLKHPLPMNMGKIVGTGYEGDATVLTKDQRERMIEIMTKKFNIKPIDVTSVLDKGIVPIKSEGVIVSWCEKHSRAAL